MCEIRQWRHSVVFIDSFDHIHCLLLILNNWIFLLEIRGDMSYVTCQPSVLKKWGQWAAVILAQISFSLDFLRKDVICKKSTCKVLDIWKLFDCAIIFYS